MCCLLQVSLRMDEGLSLGLMIRGGAEYGLGIYITGVDPGSAADAGALKVSSSVLLLHLASSFPHVCQHFASYVHRLEDSDFESVHVKLAEHTCANPNTVRRTDGTVVTVLGPVTTEVWSIFSICCCFCPCRWRLQR